MNNIFKNQFNREGEGKNPDIILTGNNQTVPLDKPEINKLYIPPPIESQIFVKTSLSLAEGNIDYFSPIRQIVIYNPTSLVVKVGFSTIVNTNSYEFIVGAQKYFVSPEINVSSLRYVIDAFVAAQVNPTLYAYLEAKFNPSVTGI